MANSTWRQVKLEEIKANIRYALNGGPFGSNLVRTDYMPAGIPIIRGTNIREGSKFSFDDLVFVSEEKADELLANNAHPGDLIFTQRGTLGQVGLIPRTSPYNRFVISQSQMKLTVDRSQVDAYFLYCYFRSPTTIQMIQNLAFSSGVPHINLDILRKFEVLLPPLLTQQKIAAILSTYDDLIENNTRRIKILEEMAQALYREWFVDFRFPTHEGVRMVESELGLVPEGWEVVKVSEKFKTILGGTPSRVKPEYWENGSIPWINSGKVNELRIISPSELITKIGYDNSSTKLMPKRTTLIAITGATLGQVSLLEIEACGNQSIVGICDIEGLYSEFLYLTISSNISSIIKHASGGAQQHINKEIINDVKILLPPKSIIDQFSVFEKPIFDMIEKIILKNANLRRTRDLLLPKLINGEFHVSELEILILEERVT